MSLGFAHELALALACSAALLGVLLGGELPWWSWMALAAPWLGGALHRRQRALPLWFGTGVAMAWIGAAVSLVRGRGLEALVLGGALTLMGLLAGRLLTRREAAHDAQALLLALLLLFAGAAVHVQVTYAVTFVLFALAAVWALVAHTLVADAEATQEGREVTLARRDLVTPRLVLATGVLSLVILLSTSALFVAFPRVGLGRLAVLGSLAAGFPQDVSLRGSPRAAAGGAVVARVRGLRYETFAQGLYLRGAVYDRPVGAAFVPGRGAAGYGRPPRLGGGAQRYDVSLQPIADDLVFALGPVSEVRVVSGGSHNPSMPLQFVGLSEQGELMLEAPARGPLRYRVVGTIAAPGDVAEPASTVAPAPLRFSALPEGLDARVVPLARELTAGVQGARAKASALRAFLRREFSYSLEQPNGAATDPLGAFLFTDRRGHCEYFATAYAILLRAAGVPSRVIGGFQGGAWDDAGEVVVFTAGDAHAWVEWYELGRGWIVDDATPASDAAPRRFGGLAAWVERLRRVWDDYVVDYSLSEQVTLVRRAVDAAPKVRDWHFDRPGPRAWVTLGAFVLAGVGVWFLRRVRPGARPRQHPLVVPLSSLVAVLRGVAPQPAETLRHAVQQALAATDVGLRDVLERTVREALAVYERERFAGAPAAPSEVLRLRRAVCAHRRACLRQGRQSAK